MYMHAYTHQYVYIVLQVFIHSFILSHLILFSDIYTPVIGQNLQVDKLFLKLRTKLSRELKYQREAFEVLGALDAVISASTIYTTKEAVVT